jgi:hypothetical protein
MGIAEAMRIVVSVVAYCQPLSYAGQIELSFTANLMRTAVAMKVHSSDVFVRTAVAPRSRSSSNSNRVSVRPAPAA